MGTDPRRALTTAGPLFVHRDDATVWQWRGWSCFLAYKFYLEGRDIVPLLRQARDNGANLIRVFGMTRYMDGGVIDTPEGYTGRLEDLPQDPNKQFWPKQYGEAYYDRLASFLDYVAGYGLRVEFTVFADAAQIMPDSAQQQTHLDRITAICEPIPQVFVEIANEPHADTGVDLQKVRITDVTDLLWSSGDYDLERIDTPASMSREKQQAARDARDFLNAKKTNFDAPPKYRVQPVPMSVDPRPPMVVGRYVSYHGSRSKMWPSEACKEGHFYYDGWDTINHEGNRSYGQACGVPCVNDEPKGAFNLPTNRWGDERYTVWQEAEESGGGFGISSAGGTAHTENGCLSKLLNATEVECAKAMFEGMSFFPLDSPDYPYEHDRQPGHKLEPVPQLGPEEWAAGESVSRGLHAITTQIVPPYVPEAKHGYAITHRAGHAGNFMVLVND